MLESTARDAVSIGERLDFPRRLTERWGASTDPEKDEAERIVLLREWADADPVSMTGWVVENLDGEERILALKQAAVVWAANDLEAAIRWAEGLVEDAEKNVILIEVGFEAARMHPRRAVDLAARMPPEKLRDELLVHAVRQWASVDASVAGAWASELPESQLRQEVLSAVAVSLSSQDGRKAAGLVAQAMVTGKEQVDASILVARNWGARQPEEAAEWISLFPDSLVREEALRGLVAGWSGRSTKAMLAWVDSLPDSPLREEALAVIGSLPRRSLESTDGSTEPQLP